MVAPAPLAGEMPKMGEEETEAAAVVIRDQAVPHASLDLPGWDIDAPTAQAVAEEALEEQEGKLSPWRTSSPSMLLMPPQDRCT